MNDAGETPLFAAAERGYEEVVQTLLAAGADKNIARNDGTGPLSIAAQNLHADVARLIAYHN